jgi:excisionase family DNA binding protein
MLQGLKSLSGDDDDYPDSEMVTTATAARILGVTDNWVVKMIRRGIIPAEKVMRSKFDRWGIWHIRKSDVTDYAHKRVSRSAALRHWRQSWARHQIEKRRMIVEGHARWTSAA